MSMFRFAYSQDGSPTIIPKNNQNSKDIKLGQVSSLSRIDKMKINKLYKCGKYQTSLPNLVIKHIAQWADISNHFFCVSWQVPRMNRTNLN